MKNSINIFLSIIIIIQFSCSSNKLKEEQGKGAAGSIPVIDTIKPNRFANIQFASKYDTSCGMPLSAGIEDTLHYNGKIYGFCSKECKDEFAKKLKVKKK